MKCSYYGMTEDRERCERCLEREQCELFLTENTEEEQELE